MKDLNEQLLSQLSYGNKKWVLPEVDDEAVVRLSQRYTLPEFVARLLHLRGVEENDLESFLSPTLKNDFPDPFSFAGMREFAEDMAQQIIDKGDIGVFADFDVDGATSTGIMTRFLRHFDIDPPVYIPDRLNEGYGPSVAAMQSLKDQGARFIIMMDCGITAFEPLSAAKDMGLQVCVFDHHEAEDSLPEAAHIINPKRKDDESGLDMLAACGVTFMACVAVNNVLREKGYYKETGKPEAPLKDWLDLVGLGTVCDMVPLIGVNRLFVKAGFDQMAKYKNAGIKALCQVSRIEKLPSPKDAGWSLGPRINAGSRVHRSDLGARLLSTDDEEEAQSIALALEECNKERRSIQSQMMKVALNKVEFLGADKGDFILVDDESFHSGLSGLVAGQLKSKYDKPAIVITYVETEDGVVEGRGSGRSIPGVHLADLFIAARNAGILEKGGGHAMAGGFTILPDRLADFSDFLSSEIATMRAGTEFVQEIKIDSIATIRSAKPELVHMLNSSVGPFGVGNEEPLFLLQDARVYQVDVLKEKHIRLMLSDSEGGTRMKAMFFGGVETPLGDYLLKGGNGLSVHLTGQFQINNWQGRESVEFHVLDGMSVIAYNQQQQAV